MNSRTVAAATVCACCLLALYYTLTKYTVGLDEGDARAAGDGLGDKSDYNSYEEAGSQRPPMQQWRRQLGAGIKSCLLAKAESAEYAGAAFWKQFVALSNGCVRGHSGIRGKSAFVGWHMGRFDEVKYFLPLAEPPPEGLHCRWLTIGIGGDARVEKEFKAAYPHCEVYGVEPGAEDQYREFEKYGTVWNIGVGLERGELSMRVREGGNYVHKKVPIYPLHEAMRQRLNSTLVHFATLDIEGFEYPLLTGLLRGHAFAAAGVAICQLDVELHTPSMAVQFARGMDSHAEFAGYMGRFLRGADYVPVLAESFGAHLKLTLVNVADGECVSAFELDKYLR